MSSVALTPLRRAAPDALGAFPDLFVDYCTDYDAVADFYPGDWRDADTRRDTAARAARRPG